MGLQKQKHGHQQLRKRSLCMVPVYWCQWNKTNDTGIDTRQQLTKSEAYIFLLAQRARETSGETCKETKGEARQQPTAAN